MSLLDMLKPCHDMYYYTGAQRFEQFLPVGRLYWALILLGLALSSERLCVYGLHGAICIYGKLGNGKLGNQKIWQR